MQMAYWAMKHHNALSIALAAVLFGLASGLALLRRWKSIVAALVCTLALLMGAQAHAAIANVSTIQLSLGASDIHTVKVNSVESRLTTNNQIVTEVGITVIDRVKGKLNKGSTYTVIVSGGRVGGLVMTVSEMPKFHEGEEALLYLRETNNGTFVVHGGLLGKLMIVPDKKTGKKYIAMENLAVRKALIEDKKAIAKAGEAGEDGADDAAAEGEEVQAEAKRGIPLEAYLKYLRGIVREQKRQAQ